VRETNICSSKELPSYVTTNDLMEDRGTGSMRLTTPAERAEEGEDRERLTWESIWIDEYVKTRLSKP